ncbi:hypothetical protein FACS1894178_1790 [Bacteroidia bacterium]|nr:hypothetical protein FACS1894178_1790 [Bacteroidia bacterium]
MKDSNQIGDIEKALNYWISSSDNNYEVMLGLYSNRHYDWALFLGHLSVEKLIKAYICKKY